MFGSSFGSIDFNSTFAQLTSNLTLDALQGDGEQEKDLVDAQQSVAEAAAPAPQRETETTAPLAVKSRAEPASLKMSSSEAEDLQRRWKEDLEASRQRERELHSVVSDRDMEIKELRRLVSQYEQRVLAVEEERERLQVSEQAARDSLSLAQREIDTQTHCIQELQQSLQERPRGTSQPSAVEGEREGDAQKAIEAPQTPAKRESEELSLSLSPPPVQSVGSTPTAAGTSIMDDKKYRKLQKKARELDAEAKRLQDALRERDEEIERLTRELDAIERKRESERLAAQGERERTTASDAERENALAVLREELQKIQSDCEERARESAQSEQAAERERERLQCALQSERETALRVQDALSESERERERLSLSLSAFSSDSSALSQETHALRETLAERDKEIAALRGERDALARETRNAEQEHAMTRSLLDERCAAADELESKVGALTDKLRELMQRYADIKARLAQSEAQIETNKSDAEKQLNAKESEAVKACLKLERVEQQLEESKTRCSELANKYADTQRDLAELRAANTLLSHTHAENEELRARLTALQEETRVKEQQHNRVLRETTEQLESRCRESDARVAQITLDYQVLLTQSRHNIESGEVLEDYKKRAQGALKKANSSVTKLTEENEKLQTALTAAQAKLATDAELIATLEEEKSNAVAALESLRAAQETTTLSSCVELETAKQRISELEAQLVEQSIATQQLQDTLVAMRPSTTSQQKEQERNAQELDAILSQSTVSSALRESSSQEKFVFVSPPTSSVMSPTLEEPQLRSQSRDDVALSASVKVQKAASNSNFVLVNELQQQIQELKKMLAQRGIELEDANRACEVEKQEKIKLIARCDELMTFLTRLKQTHEEPPSAVNIEYLKNCVFKYMSSTEQSERRRLFRVIGTILSFTARELRQVEDALVETEKPAHQVNQAISSIGNSLEGWFGTKFA